MLEWSRVNGRPWQTILELFWRQPTGYRVFLNSDRSVAPLVGCFRARSAPKPGRQPCAHVISGSAASFPLLATAARAGVVATDFGRRRLNCLRFQAAATQPPQQWLPL